jgi:kumamolisin
MKHYLKKKAINNSFTVRELASIYKFPEYKSTSAVIFILSFGGGIYGTITNNILIDGDVQKYWNSQGITQMSTVYVLFMNGAVNDISDSGSTLENTLDISTIGSCCQSIIVLCVFPNDTSFSDAFTIIKGVNINGNQLIPTIISVSWGMSEIHTDTNDMITTNSLLQQCNINVCVASGDLGATNGTNKLTCDFPSSSPFVTAVGGTRLYCPNKIYDARTKEIAWNDGVFASGGGISTLFKKPYYQSFIVGNNRMVPDISFNSDPGTGIQLYFNGNLEFGVGGTSFSAPFFAGCIALNEITSFINPILYSNNCFHDITSGSNSVYNLKGYVAKKGFDLCSGLGSMDCSKFVKTPYINLPPLVNIRINQITRLPIQTNLQVYWKSSNKNVTVNNGVIKGWKVGSSIITAYSNHLCSSMMVTVKNRKAKVKIIHMILK